jgi:antitoxin component YwqK of YwqJK toxin-antitoxin module
MNKVNLLLLISLLLFFTNCKKETDQVNDTPIVYSLRIIDTIKVDKSELTLNQNEGKWYYKNEPFYGFSQKFHQNGQLAEQHGFYKGKREGIAKKWSENGVLRIESCYNQNRLIGVYKSWWESGVLAQEANYVDGLLNGVEKKWYPTGQLSKFRNLVDGKEDGIQKAWLENGKLYVNYEAKNGRVFGMRRANSCYKLEDEKVVKK